ncbi:ecotin family protein [Thiolapillus sp.]
MKVMRQAMVVLLLAAGAFAFAMEPLEAFPAPAKGMERFVVTLPELELAQEQGLKVEIIVGKKMLTDGVNKLQLGNSIEPRSLEGWGYTYYVVSDVAKTIGTLMAPAEGSEKVMKFVTGPSLMVRYNSRLPIVVYAPKGYEVRYRVWQAGQEKAAEKK